MVLLAAPGTPDSAAVELDANEHWTMLRAPLEVLVIMLRAAAAVHLLGGEASTAAIAQHICSDVVLERQTRQSHMISQPCEIVIAAILHPLLISCSAKVEPSKRC